MTSFPDPLSPTNVTVTSLLATARKTRSNARMTGELMSGSSTTTAPLLRVIARSLRHKVVSTSRQQNAAVRRDACRSRRFRSEPASQLRRRHRIDLRARMTVACVWPAGCTAPRDASDADRETQPTPPL